MEVEEGAVLLEEVEVGSGAVLLEAVEEGSGAVLLEEVEEGAVLLEEVEAGSGAVLLEEVEEGAHKHTQPVHVFRLSRTLNSCDTPYSDTQARARLIGLLAPCAENVAIFIFGKPGPSPLIFHAAFYSSDVRTNRDFLHGLSH